MWWNYRLTKVWTIFCASFPFSTPIHDEPCHLLDTLAFQWIRFFFYFFIFQSRKKWRYRLSSKREVPRGVRNSKVRRQDKFRRDWSRHKNTCKSQSGTGPGVRRSKRPLLACHTRCRCSMETKIWWNVRFSNSVKSRYNVTNWYNADFRD